MSVTTQVRLAGITSEQKRTLIAAALGWMLDAFDVMLYAMILAEVMQDLGITKAQAGVLNSFTLVASGIGGVLFGFIADRIGRARALMLSILTYSLCSFASGLATNLSMLAVFRFVLGLGMGGEWNTGATLVAETWPTHLRAKAIAIVQSSWAIGYALAAVVAGVVMRYSNWRMVFFVGVLPALVTLWIRKDVPEPEMWRAQRHSAPGAGTRVPDPERSIWRLLSPEFRKYTLTLLVLNFSGMFAWWGLFTWIPSYLSLPEQQGGRGFGLMGTTTLLVVLNLAGMFPGYASFGWVADRLGRRKSFLLYTALAAVLVPLYASARNPTLILVLGAVVAFFGTGFFSGSGIIASEIYPTVVRARALGVTYNGARMMSSVSPLIIGWLGQQYGLSAAFYLCGAGFLISCLMATQLPETRGKQLE
jgi:MFS family permease